MSKTIATSKDERLGLMSASSGERRYMCPGSQSAEASAPSEIPTDEALEGEEIHQALEDEDFTQLDDEGRTIAERLIDLEDKAVSQWEKEHNIKTFTLQKEERLWIRNRTNLKPIASAKVDRAFVYRKWALLIDFKSGYLQTTPAYRNIQMRIQALAIWHETPQLEHITVAIAQHRFTSSLDTCVYKLEDLKRAEEELLFNLWRAEQMHAQRVPGEWCKYCRAKAFCREAAAYSLLPVPVAKGEVSNDDIFRLVSELSLQELAEIRKCKPVAEKVFDAVDARMKAMSESDLASVGWKLSNPSEVRTARVNDVWSILYNEGLMTMEEFQSICKVPIGAIETIIMPKLMEQYEFNTKKKAKQMADKLLAPGVTTVPKARHLVRLSEKQISASSGEGTDAVKQ